MSTDPIEYKIKLSPYSKVFYNEWLINPSSNLYNIVFDQMLYGKLDVKKLKKAFKRYVVEHVILNSHIQDITGEPCWVKNSIVNELEYTETPIDTLELLNYVNRSFNLCWEPLYRFSLLRIGNEIYRLILIFHHIVVDGSSTDLGIFEAISNYYNNEDYIAKYSIYEQIKLVSSLIKTLYNRLEQNKNESREFWNKQLTGIEAIDLKFLVLKKGSDDTLSRQPNPIGEIRFSYEESELAKLTQIKRKYVVTPYLYGQCIFALLIHKYTEMEQLVINYGVSIKEGRGFIYGAQVNTNLIPYKFNKSTTIKELFKQGKDFFSSLKQDGINHSYYPITNIIQGKDKNLLNLRFIQPNFKDTSFSFNGLVKVEIGDEFNIDAVDPFVFEQELKNNKLNYRVRYNKTILSEKLVDNFVYGFRKLFLKILEDLINGYDNKLLSEYNLLDKKQYQEAVSSFKQTRYYPQNKTIHKLFEEQVLKTPYNVALVYKNNKLTYLELNQKANKLAHYLHNKYDIKPDDLVVLCLDKDENMLVAILAVLKAGGAYVPVSPGYPDNRIRYILKDTKPKVILVNDKYQNRLVLENNNILFIDADKLQKELSKEDTSNPQIVTLSNNLIYVIYTSGTTGTPKGVLQQHNNVQRLFTATDDWYHFTAKDVWVMFHSYVFDFTVWEIWGALLYGGKLVIPTTEQTQDTNLFYELCLREKITILNQTPQAFYKFIDTAKKHFNTHRLLDLKYVIFGGDTLNFSNLRPWLSLYDYKQPKLINMYGITETTVHVTYKEITKKDIGQNSYIGEAIPDQTLLILDANLKPLPAGAIGELYVGGSGLARGYLNNLELTEERFIANPFQTEEEKSQNRNDKLYKTGDLIRRLPDGNLEYIGRNDLQVKVRGYRIELCEIENKLIGYPGIKQAIVIAKENVNNWLGGDKYLAAYYVADERLDETKMQDYLSRQLPAYMLPRVLIYLNQLPLTLNGKLDKKALPEPKFKSARVYEAPSSTQEKIICQEFSKILGVKEIGINDDFFELGGDSLKAITLVSALQINMDTKVADIFNLRTPKKIAESAYFGSNMLKQKLEQVKLAYSNKKTDCSISPKLQKKLDHYYASVRNLHINTTQKKAINNVLLTGATGYLGCNLLNQLLKLTNYRLFLLIRADSHADAVNRINRKFRFYFARSLDDILDLRVFVFKANLEEDKLGLSTEEYQTLIGEVDSIIHAAALVKHYGEYNTFYSANVQATINLLELSKLTNLKDFHYISTYSVLNWAYISAQANNEIKVYTEEDLPSDLERCQNVYIKTKNLGEQQTVKYREYGLTSNIYRIGNLAFMSENYKIQQNADDNAFLNWLKCILKIKCIAQELNKVEISQADLVANSIVTLFDKKQLINEIYHVFNPNLFDMASVFANDKILLVKTVTIDKFIENVSFNLNNNYHDLIVRFLLHQGWLDGVDVRNTAFTKVLQNRTQHILEKLGFRWLPITGVIFSNYLNLLESHGVDKMLKKPKIFEHLEMIAPFIPANIYWFDKNNVVLGANERTVKSIGGVSASDFIGKTPYEYYSKEIADDIVRHHEEVVRTGKTFSQEELIKDLSTGKSRYFNVIIAPLRDDDRDIIGSIGTSVEITAAKEAECLRQETEKQKLELQEQEKFRKLINQAAYDVKSPVTILLLLLQRCSGLTKKTTFEVIEEFAKHAPISIYWYNENNIMLGANETQLQIVGDKILADFIGKTPYEIFPFEIADQLVKNNQEIVRAGKVLSREERIRYTANGETKYFTSFKAPLYDNNGNNIGILGTAIDITTEKNAEHLKLEAERQKAQIEEQKNIIKIVDAVSHDIRSPARTIYAMVENNAEKIPEELRIPLRETATNIIDVASSLINRYEKNNTRSGLEEQHPVIASLSLMQILSEKKVQNVDSLVNFTSDYSRDSMFAFIKIQPSHFKRMISNLLNNAIEALDGKKGVVHLGLTTDENKKDIRIIIQDSGKGMSEETVNKIKDGATVATDKKGGHGIGLTQIRESIECNRGKFDIVSKLGEGTKMILTFPMIISPQWLAREIELNKGETVVILDDDTGIHTTWDFYFKEHINDIRLKHFTIANDAINFINTSTKKDKIFLLTDYELMNQEITGIDVIKQTGFFERAILVTSHYANTNLQKLAVTNGIKILPKDLALKVPLKICESNEKCSIIDKIGKVDVIIVEDNEMLANSEAVFFESKNKKVDKYYSPDIFLRNVLKYDKDTIVCIDNEFIGSTLNGFDIAKQLHEQGFTKLYLFSGREFEKDKIPGYLTAILKTDIDALMKLVEM